MVMMPEWSWRAVGAACWLTAALCVWLLLVSRWIINWVDSPFKTLAAGLALLALLGGSAWGACGGAGVLRALPWLVLALVGAGEIRRACLRYRFRAVPPVSMSRSAQPGWHPLTTTDLVRLSYEVTVPRLRGGRVRVAHLTDLHVDARLPFDHYVHALDTATAEDPDVLLLTGDFVSKRPNLALLTRLLRGRARARSGVFAVLGNHDYWTDPEAVRQALVQEGVRLVGGTCERVTLTDGTSVQVCGSEYPWGPPLRAADPQNADLTVVLSHTPDNVYDLSELGVTAVFAGHYHGGQIRLPLLGALVVPSRFGRRFDRGHFLIDSTHLFVSSGVGASSPPLRIHCPPDVVVVDFTPGQGTASR
jgi:predicted MPP superfamily phosphohydrolase